MSAHQIQQSDSSNTHSLGGSHGEPHRPEKPDNYLSRPLEPSIFRLRPIDDVIRLVSDFLLYYMERPPPPNSTYEIEAKLGQLIDKDTNRRIYLPVMNECVLVEDGQPWYRFESDMTAQQHAAFNQTLNTLATNSRQQGYPGSRIGYVHKRQHDEFYNMDGTRVRVTKDAKTGQVVEGGCIIKDRIANLNIYSPKANLDIRISVSVETKTSLPPKEAVPFRRRYKDRLSYAHEIFNIDLTQVKTLDMKGDSIEETTHELEVEIVDMKFMMDEKERLETNRPNRWVEAVSALLANARGLARKP